jgi:hypothetical protein
MPTDYQRKYVESIKIYHKLHAELSGITMKLTSRLRDMDLPVQYKSSLNEVVYDGADRIREVDIAFRDLVRSNWVPPEERFEQVTDESDLIFACDDDDDDDDYDGPIMIVDCTSGSGIMPS